MYKNGYKEFYDKWVASGYKKNLKPSVDRLDDFKGYSLDNIKLGTWKDNKKHQVKDILNGTGTSGKKCKKVLCFDVKMNLIATYVSYSSARRIVGYVFEKRLKSHTPDRNGYIWYYEEDYLKLTQKENL